MASTLAVRAMGERGRRVERRTLHFDLSHLDGSSEYTLHACLREHALEPHTRETLRQAREATPFLQEIPDHRLTHFAHLDLPSDAVALLTVTTAGGDGGQRLASMAIHVPKESYRAEQARARLGRAAVHPKLRALGLGGDPAPYPADIDDYKDATDAAVAFLFHHRDVMNLVASDDHGAAYVIQHHLEANPSLSDVATTILELGEAWMTREPLLDENGHQMHGDDGRPLWTQKVHADVTDAARGPLSWTIQQIKNDPELEGRQWTVQHAVTATDYGATSGPATVDGLSEVARVATSGGGFDWTLQNLSPTNGLTVDAGSLSFTPPTTTSAWTATGAWTQRSAEGGQKWPYAQDLLGGKVYLRVTTPAHPQGLATAQLVPGKASPDLTTPFTVDLTAIGPSCRATLVLNALQTTLAWSFSLEGAPLSGGTVGASLCDASGSVLQDVPLTDTSGYGTLTFDVTNHWLRHLSAYVQFYDEAGKVITPAPWDEVLPSVARAIFQPDDSKKYVALLSPVETICGIPLPAEPTTLSIPVPGNAASFQLLCGGLGTGQYDVAVCAIGLTCTVVGEIALPLIILLAGAAIADSKAVSALLADQQLLLGVCVVAGFLVTAGVATDIAVERTARPALVKLANSLGPLLLKTGLKWFIGAMFAEGTAERAAPFVDIAFSVLNCVITAAQLSQTTIEVLESPFVYQTRVARTIDIEVTLDPDHRTHEFPPESEGGQCSVVVVYDDDATYANSSIPLPATPKSDPFTVTLYGCPAAGNLTVRAFFYAANGWQAGQGQSGWLPAQGTNGATLKIGDLEITTNAVPLSADSVYRHANKIAYAGGKHEWIASPAPAATKTTPPPYISQGKQIVNWTGITLAQAPGQVAFSYEATGLAPGQTLYTITNLSVLQDPESEYAAPAVPGFAGKPAAVYDLVSPDTGGQNFWLDPSLGEFDPVTNPAGGTHLRRVDVGFAQAPPSFAPASNQSWGRFTISGDRYAIHPKGYVLGISYDTSKLQILRIPSTGGADKDAPVATLACGQGFRDGLMDGPVALGVALDGRVLILEANNQRIQAFAVDGTPVACFGDPSRPSSTMALYQPAGSRFLDVSVEAKGYIYVLGYTGDGSVAAQYFVDIYQPDGAWLVRTTGVTAAKIVVDLMRSLYTLNYETILGAGGRPEPSISCWLPPPPPGPPRPERVITALEGAI